MPEIIILDYYSGEIFLYTLPKKSMLQEEIEDFIKSKDFRLKDIEWMCGTDLEINDNRL